VRLMKRTVDSGQWTVKVFPSGMIQFVGEADTITVNCQLSTIVEIE